jgi:hypothetical protein
MDLNRHIEDLRQQLAVTAEAGGEESRALAERLTASLDSAVRLTLLDALGVAAAEITRELAPGSVELRLRGREPEFVVVPPPPADALEGEGEDEDEPAASAVTPDADAGASEDATMVRINLRLPDPLKRRIEQAAELQGASVNAWLVRAATAALDGPEPRPKSFERAPRGGQRYRGWAR